MKMRITESQFNKSYKRISEKKVNCGYFLEDVVVALAKGEKPPTTPDCPDATQQGYAVLKNIKLKPGADRKARKIPNVGGTISKTDAIVGDKRLSIKLDEDNIQLSSAGAPMIATQIELVLQDTLKNARLTEETREALRGLVVSFVARDGRPRNSQVFKVQKMKERRAAVDNIQKDIVKIIQADEEFQLRILYELVTGQLLFGDDSVGRAEYLVSPEAIHDFRTYEKAERYLRDKLLSQWSPRVSTKPRKLGDEVVLRMEPKFKFWMSQAKQIKKEEPNMDLKQLAQELRMSNPDAIFDMLTGE
jgi:hypothetical protein